MAAGSILALAACSSGGWDDLTALPEPYSGDFDVKTLFADVGAVPDADRIDEITAAFEESTASECPLGDFDAFTTAGSPDLAPGDFIELGNPKSGPLGVLPTITCTYRAVDIDVQLVEDDMTTPVAMAVMALDRNMIFSKPTALVGGEAFSYCTFEREPVEQHVCGAVWIHDEVAVTVRVHDTNISAQAIALWLSDALPLWVAGDDAPTPTPAGQLPAFLTDGGANITTGGSYVADDGASADMAITVFNPVELSDENFGGLGRLCGGSLTELEDFLQNARLQLDGGFAQAVEVTATSPPAPLNQYVVDASTPYLSYEVATERTITWSISCPVERTDTSARYIGVIVVLPPEYATESNPDQLIAACPTALTMTNYVLDRDLVASPATPYGPTFDGWSFPVPDVLDGRCLA